MVIGSVPLEQSAVGVTLLAAVPDDGDAVSVHWLGGPELDVQFTTLVPRAELLPVTP